MTKRQLKALKNSAFNPKLEGGIPFKPHAWGDYSDEPIIPSELGTWKRFTDGYELIDKSSDDLRVLGFTRQISKKDEAGELVVFHGAWVNDGASVVDLGNFETVRQARKAIEENLNG